MKDFLVEKNTYNMTEKDRKLQHENRLQPIEKWLVMINCWIGRCNQILQSRCWYCGSQDKKGSGG